MIDYRAQRVLLDKFRQELAQLPLPNTTLDSIRNQQLDEISKAPGAALLGALVDQLIWHASSDGIEIELAARASSLWSQGVQLFTTLGIFRSNLESALSGPSSQQQVDALNEAMASLKEQTLATKAAHIELSSLKNDVHAFAFLKEHPRQLDKPVENWPLSDVFLARRTDAFVRSLRSLATTTQTSAFATGALSSYSANVCGSAFLLHVVGGPRRSHRHRDRVARNTLGSWFGALPGSGAAPEQIASTIYEEMPVLPPSISSQVTGALSTAYGAGALSPTLLNVGYQRLIRHLQLLGAFEIPDPPSPPNDYLSVKLYAEPSQPASLGMPPGSGIYPAPAQGSGSGSGSGVVPQTTPKAPDALTNADAPDSTEVDCGAFWEMVGEALLWFLGGWISCLDDWSDGNTCPMLDHIEKNYYEAFPDGVYAGPEYETDWPQALTAMDAGNIAMMPQAIAMVGTFFDLQCLIWESLSKALDFLATHGLIYPDGMLDQPRFKQFLAVPAVASNPVPQKPEPDGNKLHLFPTQGLEQATSTGGAAVFPQGANPTVLFATNEFRREFAATALATNHWLSMSTGQPGSTNYDSDADRGFCHPCWRARGSVLDVPIDVEVLAYQDGD